MTWSPTKSDRVRSGLRQVRGLCLVIDLSVQSRHVQILWGRKQSLWVRVVEFGNNTTRPDQQYFART